MNGIFGHPMYDEMEEESYINLSSEKVKFFHRMAYIGFLYAQSKSVKDAIKYIQECKGACEFFPYKDFTAKLKELKDIETKRRKSEGKSDFVSELVFEEQVITAEYIDNIKAIVELKYPYIKEDYVIQNNVKLIAELMNLSSLESLIFQFYTHFDRFDYDHHDLPIAIGTIYANAQEFFRIMFNGKGKEIDSIIRGDTSLLGCGLLTSIKEGSNNIAQSFMVLDKIYQIMKDPFLDLNGIEEQLFPNMLKTTLVLDDYQHISPEIHIVSKLIEDRFKHPEKVGCNILFWGSPGTGKSELTLLLSKSVGYELKVVGDIGSSGDMQNERGRAERLVSLKLAQNLFKNQKHRKIVLLFDEMEDIVRPDPEGKMSKAFINRLIEQSPVTIIWTCNRINYMDSAMLRRMKFSIHFKVPPVSARKRIWEKYSKEKDYNISDDMISALSTHYDVVPALIANSVEIAKVTELSDSSLPSILNGLDKVMNNGQDRKLFIPKSNSIEFDASLCNTSIDLVNLTNKIVEAGNNGRGVSILCYGPSGTGKSAWAKDLAKKLNVRFMLKDAAKIVSPYIGETEKNISEMFENAGDDEGTVLTLDEADTFLSDRRGANSWSVSVTNQLLVCMEQMTDHSFVCTTNLNDKLDPASKRRFTFKIKFDFLKSDQISKLFKLYFKHDAPKDILQVDMLTPGDFKVVLDKINLLKINDIETITEYILEELKEKEGFNPNPVGF